jgi:hypothetical protein
VVHRDLATARTHVNPRRRGLPSSCSVVLNQSQGISS